MTRHTSVSILFACVLAACAPAADERQERTVPAYDAATFMKRPRSLVHRFPPTNRGF